MDSWVTPPKRVTSPTWGLPPPGKHALRMTWQKGTMFQSLPCHKHEARRSFSSLIVPPKPIQNFDFAMLLPCFCKT